jgi:hypothetical protein
MPTLKRPLAIRVDPALLQAVRECASLENRTMTNFIETVLRRRVEELRRDGAASSLPATLAGAGTANGRG